MLSRRALTMLFESYYAFKLKMSTYRNLIFKKLHHKHRSAALQIKSYLLQYYSFLVSLCGLFPPSSIQTSKAKNKVTVTFIELFSSGWRQNWLSQKLLAIAEVESKSPETLFCMYYCCLQCILHNYDLQGR